MVSFFGTVFKLVGLLSAFSGASASPVRTVLNVREGDGFQIRCLVLNMFGVPQPIENIIFMQDGQPVLTSERKKRNGGFLKVDEVQMSDAGVYSCKFGAEVKELGAVIVQPRDSRMFRITMGAITGCGLVIILMIGIQIYRKCRTA